MHGWMAKAAARVPVSRVFTRKIGKDESKGDKRYEIYENAGIWQ